MKDVLIIGGGFAGLAAGVELAEAGWRVRLLEQRPHLGGRARSFVDGETGSVVDNGQHLFMGCYHATRRFLSALGTLERIRFQRELAVTFLDADGRRTSLRCPRLRAPWHLLAGVLRSGSFTAGQKLQVLRLGRRVHASGSAGDSASALSVEAWLAGQGQSEALRRNFWNLLSIAMMNEDPKLASAALFERVLRLALFRSPQDSRLGIARVGLSECYTEAAADFISARGGRVELSRNVTRLLVREGVCEGVELGTGERILSPVVVSAVPWFAFPRLLPDELLRSQRFFSAILRLQSAPIISINLWFDRPVTELEFAGLRGTTVQWMFNKGQILQEPRASEPKARATNPAAATAPPGSYLSLVLSGAHRHIERSREDLVEEALREVRALLPEARGAELLRALVLKERQATFSPRPETESARPACVTPLRGLYLAGDWTATGLPSTIEGAVQSGYTAAQAVAAHS
jgi:hydroxysqualene dehydroxylase